jgi:NAD(P)H-hydrate epimerase
MTLPEALYSAAQARQLDQIAIEHHSIAGYTLMQRAGEAAFRVLRRHWPRARRIMVVCGPGNNGGDGYVVARLAHSAGLQVQVLALADPMRLRGDAYTAREAAQSAGVTIQGFEAARLRDSEVIVDALFGTGLERDVENEWREAIEAINAALGTPVLAIDIPSGLHADAGRVLGVAVRAQVTVTFIGLKTGLFTGHGRDYSGELVFDNLGVPAEVYGHVHSVARRLSARALVGLLPRRPRSLHKGRAGHVGVIGGSEGMAGAARLAGEAAARAGAGLTTLLTHPAHAAHLQLTRPELLTQPVADAAALRGAWGRITVLAIGPGLGQGRWARALLATALENPLPKVIDADGLNLIAADPLRRDDWILTPHPAEAARLLGIETREVQAQRFEALQALLERYGGICVLKGSGTLIGQSAGPDIWLCDAGNPGMASGGMGDVLTGMIAALLAQGLTPFDAARLAVWVHATAADDAAQTHGEIGLLASDLLPYARRRLNQLAADVY